MVLLPTPPKHHQTPILRLSTGIDLISFSVLFVFRLFSLVFVGFRLFRSFSFVFVRFWFPFVRSRLVLLVFVCLCFRLVCFCLSWFVCFVCFFCSLRDIMGSPSVTGLLALHIVLVCRETKA